MPTNDAEYDRRYYQDNKKRILKRKTEQMRKYRKANPEKSREVWRRYKHKRRTRMFDLYGHECSICGFTDKRALTLDHINNNGNEERRTIGESRIMTKAIATHLPGEYRILCMNCQFIERENSASG